MAILDEEIIIEELPEESSPDPIPAGWYEATTVAAELKDTKDYSGKYIKVRYDIAGPTHQGRCVFGNLNIRNASPRAEEIGKAQLGSLCKCIGITDRLRDTDQLVGHAVQIKVGVRKDTTGQYGDQNDVKGFKPIDGDAPVMMGPSPQSKFAPAQKFAPAAKAAPATAPASAPWKK